MAPDLEKVDMSITVAKITALKNAEHKEPEELPKLLPEFWFWYLINITNDRIELNLLERFIQKKTVQPEIIDYMYTMYSDGSIRSIFIMFDTRHSYFKHLNTILNTVVHI